MVDDTKIEKLAKMLQEAMDNGFCGEIAISFFKGGISNIVRKESIKI